MANKKSSNTSGMRTVRLGEIFRERRESGVPGLPTMSVTMGSGIVDRESMDRRVLSELRPDQHLLARKGDIAYNMMRMWQGVSGLVPYDCLVSPAYVVLEPLQGINSEYAAYLFKSESTIRKLHRFSQGLTGDRLRLYFDQLKTIPVDIPSEEIQAFSARVLNSIDEAIEETRMVIGQIRRLKTALLQEVLANGIPSRQSSQKTVKSRVAVPTTWTPRTLDEVVPYWQYGLSEVLKNSGQFPCFRMNNYDAGRIVATDLKFIDLPEQTARQYRLEPGDILFNRTNSRELVGKIGIFELDGDYVFASYLVRMRCDAKQVSPQFLNMLLNTEFHQRRIRDLSTPGVSQSNINVENLKKLVVPIPCRDEQDLIVTVVNGVEQRIASEVSVLTHLSMVKTTLSQDLLAGRIAVSVPAAKSAANVGKDARKKRKE